MTSVGEGLCSSSSVDRWTQVVDLYVQSVVCHSKYRVRIIRERCFLTI